MQVVSLERPLDRDLLMQMREKLMQSKKNWYIFLQKKLYPNNFEKNFQNSIHILNT